MSSRQIVERISNGLLILAFFAALWLAWVAKLLNWGDAPCPYENRVLAAAPDFHTTRLAVLPKKIEAYLQDHLPYRAEFIKYYALYKHRCLGLGNASILIGKDEFLFYDLAGCQTLDYMGQAPFSAEQLDQWRLFLERRQAYLAARNCRYLFVIAPNSASVYPEKLPDRVAANKGTSRREQLLQYLAAHGSTVRILDLTPPLCEAKRAGQVFFTADSHWNGLGYHVAMDCICRRLHEWFPEVRWNPLGTDYQVQTSIAPTGLWYMLGCLPGPLPPEPFLVRCKPAVCRRTVGVVPADWPAQLPGPVWTPVATEKNGPGRRLVVLGDSYMGNGPNPEEERPLGDCFQRALFIGNPTAARVPHGNLESIVYQERPDVVVEEAAERSLQIVPDTPMIAPEERNYDLLTSTTRRDKSQEDRTANRPATTIQK